MIHCALHITIKETVTYLTIFCARVQCAGHRHLYSWYVYGAGSIVGDGMFSFWVYYYCIDAMNVTSRGYKMLELCASNKVIAEKKEVWVCIFIVIITPAHGKHGVKVSSL